MRRTKLFAVFLFSIFMFQLLFLASPNISLSAQNNVSTNKQNLLQQHVDPTFASPETPPEMVGGFNVTADMVPFIKQGDVNPGHELHITKISYFAKYVVWNFLELNETHWRVKGFVNASLVEDVKAVLNGSMEALNFKNKWFPEVKPTDLPKLAGDCGKLGTYPLKALTSDVKFEVSSVNFLNGTFTFYMIFPNGFKSHQKVEWGLGTVTVDTASIYPPNNAATLDTTPDFRCTPVSNVSTTVKVTLFVNGVASGTIINAPNNTQVTITCNRTLPVSDAKIPWYFNITDASGTVSTETRYISIGAYFKVPAVLINPNATVTGCSYWTYYLNASTTNLTVSRPIQIPDGNITLDGQGYTLDGDDVADYGIYVYRSETTTTNITITNITVQDWDEHNIYFYNSNGNTVKFVTSLSSLSDGLCLSVSDGNSVFNVTVNSNNHGLYIGSSVNNSLFNITANYNTNYGLFLSSSDDNTLTNVTANSNAYGLYLFWADNNVISASQFQNNRAGGVYLYSAGNPANKLYNNLFNNTVNVKFAGTIYSNQWNTTKTAGTRIYSNGIEIGGNYWTNSTGNGPSDIGEDADDDGFLDLYYDVQNNVLTSNPTASNNMDLLPYSDEYAVISPPTYSDVSTNTTLAGATCKFSVLWNDNVNVSGFIFGTNNTGTWQNDTWVAFTVFYNSTAAWSNVTKILNATVHIRIEWQVWCNDTSNNWGSTGIQALTTTQLVTSQLTQTVQPSHSTYRTVSNIRQLTQQSTISTSMLRIEALTRVFLQSISTLAQTLRNIVSARDSVQPTQTKTTILKALYYPRTEVQAATLSTQTLRLNVLQRTAFQQTPALTSLLRGLIQQRLSLQTTALSLYLVRGLTQTRQTIQPSQTSTQTLRVLLQPRLATQPLSALAQSLRQTIIQRIYTCPTSLTTLNTRTTAVQRQLPITLSILHQILTVITPYNVRIVIQSITVQVDVPRLTTLNRAIPTSTALTAQTFKIKTLLRTTIQPIQTLTLIIRRYTAIRISLQPLQVFFTSIRLQTLTRTAMHLATLRTTLISAITPPPAPPPAPFVPPPPIIAPPQLYTLIVHVIDLFGHNAPGLTIKVIDEKGNLVATLTTDAEGTTDPVQLAKGTYTVEIYKDEMLQFSKTVILTEPTTLKIQIGIPVVLTFPVLLTLILIGVIGTLAIARRKR